MVKWFFIRAKSISGPKLWKQRQDKAVPLDVDGKPNELLRIHAEIPSVLKASFLLFIATLQTINSPHSTLLLFSKLHNCEMFWQKQNMWKRNTALHMHQHNCRMKETTLNGAYDVD